MNSKVWYRVIHAQIIFVNFINFLKKLLFIDLAVEQQKRICGITLVYSLININLYNKLSICFSLKLTIQQINRLTNVTNRYKQMGYLQLQTWPKHKGPNTIDFNIGLLKYWCSIYHFEITNRVYLFTVYLSQLLFVIIVWTNLPFKILEFSSFNVHHSQLLSIQMKGEKELIEKLLQTEIDIFRSIRDGSAYMQHMEDFYYITLLEVRCIHFKRTPRIYCWVCYSPWDMEIWSVSDWRREVMHGLSNPIFSFIPVFLKCI